MPSETGFTVVDRRGSARIETPEPEKSAPETKAAEPEKGDRKSRQIWQSTAFMIVMLGNPQSPLIAGRAAGLRQDGLLAVADYFFPPIWPEHLEWTKEARRRLNTFLGCECTPTIQCSVHNLVTQNWMREDTARLEKIAHSPLPECIEVLGRAERARQQSKIVIPR